jgi:MoaA/NifB/PqqE/SkfB family radical SAM enzyme
MDPNAVAAALRRRAIREMVGTLSSDGDRKKIARALALAERFAPEARRDAIRTARQNLHDDHPALLMMRTLSGALDSLSPRCRERLIEAVVVNNLLRGGAIRRDLLSRGLHAPSVMLISPTMRCNLACEGCYAAEYDSGRDLEPRLLQRIVDEGNEIGTYLFTMLGGEPFVYEGLLELAAANPGSYFQVFTNGTMLTQTTVERLAGLGNVAPMLSLEGTRDMTDARRGTGVHDAVLRAMDLLGEYGVPFGYSATVTRKNWRTLISAEFVDLLVAKGVRLGWHFLYMPIGRDPDLGLMPTPQEREEFRLGMVELRATRPFFPVDFWGDAPWVGGCIAGRRYMHINSEGWVEPCIFTHFATSNIRDLTVLDAFNSPFFNEIRSRQPFNHNLYRPCMWLDNPHCSEAIMEASGARPTHDGADVMLKELHAELQTYSLEAGRILDPAWEEAKRGGRIRTE